MSHCRTGGLIDGCMYDTVTAGASCNFRRGLCPYECIRSGRGTRLDGECFRGHRVLGVIFYVFSFWAMCILLHYGRLFLQTMY